jgi:mannose-6-phosphate isomerase
MKATDTMNKTGYKEEAMDYKALLTRPIPLEDLRVRRAYVGGTLLNRWKGLPAGEESNLSEEWQMSVIEVQVPGAAPGEGISVYKEGGQEARLTDIIASDPQGFLGKDYVREYGPGCGMGVRTGDSVVRLVMQCHPKKEDAMRYLNFPFGKTEAWYIVETREIDGERPYTLLGFKPGVTKEQIRQMFEAQDVEGMAAAMHKIPIEKGDVILVHEGMPHAMGPGAVFLEVAEACDFTFKLERDVGSRLLSDEEMHYGIGFENMLECFDYTTYTEEQVRRKCVMSPTLVYATDGGEIYKLFGYEDTPRFTMYKFVVDGELSLKSTGEYAALVCTEADGTFVSEDGRVTTVRQGQGAFLPADYGKLICRGKFTFIYSDGART